MNHFSAARVAEGSRRRSAGINLGQLRCYEVHRSLNLRHLYVLAVAGSASVLEGSERSRSAVEPAYRIQVCRSAQHWTAVAVAHQRGHPSRCFHRLAHADVMRMGTGVPQGRHLYHDYLGV